MLVVGQLLLSSIGADNAHRQTPTVVFRERYPTIGMRDGGDTVKVIVPVLDASLGRDKRFGAA
jgi:hypothetical protein